MASATSTHPRTFPTVLALGLLTGCSLVYSDELSKKQCSEQSDCDSYARELGTPLICRSSACQAPFCADTASCPTGSTCVQNQCIAPRDAGMQGPKACALDSECSTGERCGFDGFCYSKWGCLDQSPDWPTTNAADFTFRMEASWAGLRDPAQIPDMLVRACSTFSPECDPPLVAAARRIENGVITVPFSQPFTGSIQLASASTGLVDGGVAADAGTANPLPTLIHFTAVSPLVGAHYAQNRLILLSNAVFKLFEGQLQTSGVQVVFDETKSVVALQVHDCGGRPAAGVSMVPNNTTAYTFVPIQGEIEPQVGQTRTGSDGTAIIINLDSGYQYFTVRDEDAQRQLTDTLVFTVQSSAVNYVLYYPRNSALQRWNVEARRRGLLP